MNAEQERLDKALKREEDWKLWGPYLSERAWGTVREDYSADGSAWEYFPFEQAHLKAFRWNEDGIAGICDRYQNLCFAVSMWNGKDDILKERFYGVTGNQGNHGEDVKDYYFYLDSSPTHSYMKMLYKYPQEKFPYEWLKNENLKRDKTQPEFELLDTGIFDQNKYFDVFIEYAKAISRRYLYKNYRFQSRRRNERRLHLLPHIWFRNDWSWTAEAEKPRIKKSENNSGNFSTVITSKKNFGEYYFYCEETPELLFCENETNCEKLYNGKNLFGIYQRRNLRLCSERRQISRQSATSREQKPPHITN